MNFSFSSFILVRLSNQRPSFKTASVNSFIKLVLDLDPLQTYLMKF